MCSSCVSFWYVSVADFFLPAGFGVESMTILSFSTSAKGTVPDFFAGAAFLGFLELGGVFEKPVESLASPSSSLITFRFLAGAFGFNAVCVSFFALEAAGFVVCSFAVSGQVCNYLEAEGRLQAC